MRRHSSCPFLPSSPAQSRRLADQQSSLQNAVSVDEASLQQMNLSRQQRRKALHNNVVPVAMDMMVQLSSIIDDANLLDVDHKQDDATATMQSQCKQIEVGCVEFMWQHFTNQLQIVYCCIGPKSEKEMFDGIVSNFDRRPTRAQCHA